MNQQIAHMLSNWVHELSKHRKTTRVEPKTATSILTAIYYTSTTFGFPRVTQKPSRIVKENEAKNNITFNVRQLTNDPKRVPFRFPFSLISHLFGALAPEDPSTFPKSQKGAQTVAPRVPQAAPPKLKGRHNEPGLTSSEKTASVCNFFHIVFRWLSQRPKKANRCQKLPSRASEIMHFCITTAGFCFNLRGRNSPQATEIRRTSSEVAGRAGY